MKASVAALVLIAIIASAFLGYCFRLESNYSVKTLTTTYTETSTETVTENGTSTLTYTTTATRVLTKTEKEVITSPSTITTTYIKTLPKTVTEAKTLTATKYLTVTKTVTETVVKAVVINPSISELKLQCSNFSRYVLTPDDVACALSQASILQNLSKALAVDGDPNLTAVRIAEWIANNIKYVNDNVAFHVVNYVQEPLETLKNKFGDCEDLSLLEVSLLLGTGLYDKVLVAHISYSNIAVSHVEAGFESGNEYFMVPWVNQTYPMDLLTDYYGYSELADAHIRNVTLFVGELTPSGSIKVSEEKISSSSMSYIYPPPTTPKDIDYLQSSINNFLVSEGYNALKYPKYLYDLWGYLQNYLPSEEPPIKPPIAYFEYVIPIDWFSSKSPEWIAWRVGLILNESWGSIESGILPNYKGCLHAFVKTGKVLLNQVEFRPDGSTVMIKRLTPSIIIVVLEPEACDVPEVNAELGDEFMITVDSASEKDISILFYNGSAEPVLGVVKSGYVLKGVPYVIADYWGVINGKTVIKFSKASLLSKLSPGVYELIVWWSNKIAYVKIFNLS